MEGSDKRYSISYDPEIPGVFAELKCVMAISTYQAGKVIFIGSSDGKSLFQIPVTFRKPMGIALLANKMAVATLDEIQIFAASKALAQMYPDNPGVYDRLYVPRATYYCGQTDLHDLEFGNGGLWAVNTLFSCISTYDINHSFTPRWKPPFVTDLKPEDRCHLNGMAMIDSMPAYATAFGQTDTKEGWRNEILKGGVLMAVPSGDIILENLPMPHSPRVINNKLYLLLSATGEIITVDAETRSYAVIARINGFIRGLDSYGNYMFVGVSKARKTSTTFKNLPVDDMADDAGIVVIDLENRSVVGGLKYLATVEEIYDVRIIPDIIKPGLIGVNDDRHKYAVSTPAASFWKAAKTQPEDKKQLHGF